MQIAQLEFQLDDSILTQRTLRLRIGTHDVKLAVDRAAGKLRKEVEVPGFRMGKAPLALVRKHHRRRVNGDAFQELKQAAIEQVLKQLPDKDQPFLPPEVLERDKVKVWYGRSLELAVKYMVDPAGLGKNPEQPAQQQGAVIPGSQVNHPAAGPMGVPSGPQLPSAPQTGQPEPSVPSLPSTDKE